MSDENEENKIVLPHHVQQPLCTTRLPYRQGRKLTAVKVYTINSESTHLLVFNVPSINLRQEAKALFLRFGKLLRFNLSPEHMSEAFTETYHAVYEKIQSARLAKKFLDTKTFYGSPLHVCYAPEFESLVEMRQKLLQRRSDVIHRLNYLKREANYDTNENKSEETEMSISKTNEIVKKVNMGDINIISVGKQIRDVFKHSKRKFNRTEVELKKSRKSTAVPIVNEITEPIAFIGPVMPEGIISKPPIDYNKPSSSRDYIDNYTLASDNKGETGIEIIDVTSAQNEVVTNMNEMLNYDKFGDEVVKKIPQKPLNKIQFTIKKFN